VTPGNLNGMQRWGKRFRAAEHSSRSSKRLNILATRAWARTVLMASTRVLEVSSYQGREALES